MSGNENEAIGDILEDLNKDVDNIRRLSRLLGNEGFVEALENADNLVRDVDKTLDRVEMIEREVNHLIGEVDEKLIAVEQTVRTVEMKIEASFSAAFLILATGMYLQGRFFLSAALLATGIIFSTSLLTAFLSHSKVKRLAESSKRASRLR